MTSKAKRGQCLIPGDSGIAVYTVKSNGTVAAKGIVTSGPGSGTDRQGGFTVPATWCLPTFGMPTKAPGRVENVVRFVMDAGVGLFYRTMALFRRQNQKRTAELLGYRVGANNNEITILFEQGYGDKPGEVSILAETSDLVQLQIRYEFFNGMRILIAIPRETVATLREPLGNRKVLDEAGNEVPRA